MARFIKFVDRASWWLGLIAIILVWFLIIMPAFFMVVSPPKHIRAGTLTDEEMQKHKRLMQKHGDYTIHYDSGKPEIKWFIRDGRKCRWV